jgi:predicted metallo-beta-lactamase superfamily hydrolase
LDVPENGAKHAKTFEAADGKTYTYGQTKLCFSPAVAHGSDDHSLGWVIMATVECGGERFMFAPDVQGPIYIHTAELILAAKPSVLMIGGPPLYLEGGRVSEHQIKQALLNLERLAEAVPLIILEHHALRDEAWREKLSNVLAKAQARGHSIVTELSTQEKKTSSWKRNADNYMTCIQSQKSSSSGLKL